MADDKSITEFLEDKLRNGNFTYPEIYCYMSAHIVSSQPINQPLLMQMIGRADYLSDGNYRELYNMAKNRLRVPPELSQDLKENYESVANGLFSATHVHFEE